MDSANNPADYITRGKTLAELAEKNRWSNGPAFLYLSSQHWPTEPEAEPSEDTELCKATFCGSVTTAPLADLPDASQFTSFKDMVEAAVLSRGGRSPVQPSCSGLPGS